MKNFSGVAQCTTDNRIMILKTVLNLCMYYAISLFTILHMNRNEKVTA